VAVDAFLVRMTLTPAVMHLLGDHAWWIPRWLDRLLPDLDVEGAALRRRLAERESSERKAWGDNGYAAGPGNPHAAPTSVGRDGVEAPPARETAGAGAGRC
jgi:RND superfamily putative drug exporter